MTARVIECTFILVGILSVLGIITLRNQVAGASDDRRPRAVARRVRRNVGHLVNVHAASAPVSRLTSKTGDAMLKPLKVR